MFRAVCASLFFLCTASSAFAVDQKQLDQIVSVIESFCLSGKSYSITASINGNITLTKLMPGAAGSARTVVVDLKGGVGYTNEQIRLAFDLATRDCMSSYIKQIIDLIVAPPPPKQGKFITPKIDDIYVDSCNFKNTECGQEAANTFCRWSGYSKSVSWGTSLAGGDSTYRQGEQVQYFGAGDGTIRKYLVNVVCE